MAIKSAVSEVAIAKMASLINKKNQVLVEKAKFKRMSAKTMDMAVALHAAKFQNTSV